MDRDVLVASWIREEGQPFTGWDFSYLDGRMLQEQAPWSYSTLTAERMRHASAVLDMGTGGGERLLALRVQIPDRSAQRSVKHVLQDGPLL
jgi:hypothetical protein